MPNHTWCDYIGGPVGKMTLRTSDPWNIAIAVWFKTSDTSDNGVIAIYERTKPNEFTFIQDVFDTCDNVAEFVSCIEMIFGMNNWRDTPADAINEHPKRQNGVIFGWPSRAKFEADAGHMFNQGVLVK